MRNREWHELWVFKTPPLMTNRVKSFFNFKLRQLQTSWTLSNIKLEALTSTSNLNFKSYLQTSVSYMAPALAESGTAQPQLVNHNIRNQVFISKVYLLHTTTISPKEAPFIPSVKNL